MRRIMAMLSVMAVMLAMSVAPALATQPVEGSPQRGGSSFSSNNCVAYNSAQVIHNGSACVSRIGKPKSWLRRHLATTPTRSSVSAIGRGPRFTRSIFYTLYTRKVDK